MRRARSWSLALGCVATLAGALATPACSSSSSSGSGAGDGGGGDSTVVMEEAGSDGNVLPDVVPGPAVVVPRAYVVHASPDAPPLRFCLGFGAPSDGGVARVAGALRALPDAPAPGFPRAGVYPGYAARFDDHGLDLSTLTIEVFALDATAAPVASSTSGGVDGGGETPCEALIGSDGLGATSDAGGVLRPGVDYWSVGVLPQGMLAHGSTWLLALTGCVPGEANAAALCPAGYDANAGNLSLVAMQLDTITTPSTNGIDVQFAQASSEWDNLGRARAATTSAGFLVPLDAATADANANDAASGDAGGASPGDAAGPATPWAGYVPIEVADDAGFGGLVPAKLADVPGALVPGAAFYAQLTDPAGNAVPPSPVGALLPDVLAFTWPSGVPDAGVLRAGAGFVFVLVGNPAVTPGLVNPADGGAVGADAGGVPNGHAPHFLALPVANP